MTPCMTLGHAQELLKKLESLDSEFKQQHLTVIDSIPEDDQLDDNLAKEQHFSFQERLNG